MIDIGKYRVVLYILLGFLGLLIATNPSPFDFEQKIETLFEFSRFSIAKQHCIVSGRKENFIIFSIYQVTNYCDWEDYMYLETEFLPENNVENKTYIGLLGRFHAIE